MQHGKSRIQRMFQEGSAKIRVPRDGDRRALEAVLINTSGGLTGGDRLDWEIEAQAGSHLTLDHAGLRKGLPVVRRRRTGLGAHFGRNAAPA